MGMRPPPSNGNDRGPEAVDFGIAALAAQLDSADLTFPATTEEIVRSLGDPEVPYDPHGNSVTLSTVLEETPRNRFEDQDELLDVLHPVFEEYRTGEATGVIGWIRRHIPFS